MTLEDASLIELLDACDDAGLLRLVVPEYRLHEALPEKKLDAARQLLEAAFGHQPLLTLKLDRLKRHTADVLEHLERAPDGAWHLVVRAAPLMLLPGEAPREELAELRALFVAMQQGMLERPQVRCDIQLCNNRDRAKRVYGSLGFRTCAQGDTKAAHDEALTLALKGHIEASAALSRWLREVALALQKLGPWSWCCITEDHLFGAYRGPWFEHFSRSRPTAREPEQA